VYVEGGLLYAGDVHASMGDGELTGMANECRADLTLSCSVLTGKSIPWARVETPDALVQLNCYRPLEQAVEQAFLWMIDWLTEDYGVSPSDAYLLLSVASGVRINIYQMTRMGRLNYTVGVGVPRFYFE
jgi:acetamidase/formamidase